MAWIAQMDVCTYYERLTSVPWWQELPRWPHPRSGFRETPSKSFGALNWKWKSTSDQLTGTAIYSLTIFISQHMHLAEF